MIPREASLALSLIILPPLSNSDKEVSYIKTKSAAGTEILTPPYGCKIYHIIFEALTEISGGPELFIDMGSTINLTCSVKYTPEPPPTLVWKHSQEEINFDSPRGGISLVTVKGVITTSRLLIQNAKPEDSGEYSCIPSNSKLSTVRVHILNGEHPAAMHHGQGSMPLCSPVVSAFIVSITLLLPLMNEG
ncbi:hypothetical protein V9T40_011212 [Parthenolecanium corni]|uniref:Ig-like domain-containing protein n=1 Tax=Parthenolecanium corni TaxID=536013 RepID=A0AAN9TJK2_9HEMI